ncbi:hypothetical protein DH2020_025381 [Rehmannia glutinosa]|uniref:Glutamate receptor n=1 Tax=Rehmannia glutinosa TaxID=99300 RepID=A0ABR0W3D4_REHGL
MAGAQIIPVRVGVVLDMDGHGEMALTCISMALKDFYATHDHYKTRLVLANRDSKGDVVGAAAAVLSSITCSDNLNSGQHSLLKSTFSEQANFLIALGHKAQVPIITFSATSPSLSSLRNPYFIRATLNDSSQVDAIVAITQAFGWREVVPIYEDNEFGERILPFLTDALELVNIRVPYRSAISPLATDDQIVAELYKLMTKQTRVFVVHTLSPLASRLFTKAKQLGMMSREYAWIITNGVTNELSSMDRFVIESMVGVIGVKPYVPKTKELDELASQYRKMVQKNKKAIIRNPTYRGTNISRNATDLEAFGVSETGPKLIQALSTTTFKGLAGDFELVNGQLQAPPFQIVNMFGPGDRGIGYWTKKNGIVRELNFTSADTNTYSTSKSNLGSIIWPDNASFPPKGWVIPTNGKKLRVAVPVKHGFDEFVRVIWKSDNSTNVEGYCIDIFDAVMAALPYHVPYEYVPFATLDHNMAGDYNALAYQVHLGEYDAVAGDVTIIANRSQYVDFTLPYTESGISMVVPIQDDKRKNTWLFVKPLTWELWLTSFCSFVFLGVLIWILEHRINEDFRGPFWYQVGMIFSFAFSTMVFAHIQKLQPKVRDANQLIKNKDYVGYMNGSFVFGFLKNMGFEESQLKAYDSPEQLDEFLSKGSKNFGVAAAFHETPYIKLFLGKYCSKYTTAGPTYKADGFGLYVTLLPPPSFASVFPLGSPLAPDVSRAILNVTEDPKMVRIDSQWRPDPEFTMWSKIAELLQKFDNKDLRSHTFKKHKLSERDDGCCCDCMQSNHENYQQSPSSFSLASPRTNCPPSPIPSSPSEHNIDFQGDRRSSSRECNDKTTR